MADLAIGATAFLSFWRDLGFKAAAVMTTFDLSARRRCRSCEADDRRRQFRARQRRTPFVTDIVLPAATIALLVAGAPRTADAQNTMTFLSAAPEREEATASLIFSSG